MSLYNILPYNHRVARMRERHVSPKHVFIYILIPAGEVNLHKTLYRFVYYYCCKVLIIILSCINFASEFQGILCKMKEIYLNYIIFDLILVCFKSKMLIRNIEKVSLHLPHSCKVSLDPVVTTDIAVSRNSNLAFVSIIGRLRHL